ncbi:hypothetical protein F8S13_03105 [Chloroflexia bacterium SDU3-3]|nr:hypothetical protein F8S13_03105 [Chloroflexia bacterium SDU3-3]
MPEELRQAALQVIQSFLAASDIACSLQGGGVRFARWPTVGVFVTHAEHEENSYPSGEQISLVHLDLAVALNVEREDSLIVSCATGIGAGLGDAVANAADQWCACVIPPIFSLLHQQAMYGTLWLPDGLPGWDLFVSPYVMRGQDVQADLGPFLEQQPLVVSLGHALLAELPPERMFNTVMLYRGQNGNNVFVDCYINGEKSEPAELALLGLPWPDIERFHSVRLFVFCMRSQG